MADYLQDFQFDFDQEVAQDTSLYACSLSSSTCSLASMDEPSTPLLYNSISPSLRNNNDLIIHDLDESFIELDISNSFQPIDHKSNMISFNQSTTLNENINNTIEKGSNHLKNNYKLWLSHAN